MKVWGPYSVLGLGVALLAALADQVHKVWTIGLLEAVPGQKIVLAPFFDLELAWNRGVSYGLLKQDSDAGRFALSAFAILAVFALAYWIAHFRTRIAAIGAGLVMGGAIGNAADRFHYGAVADFFAFHVGNFHWYIFNLADVAIVAGVGALLLDSLWVSHKSAGKQA
jgi:signal peptidase II